VRLALAVGVGLSCGIAPIWGFQTVVSAALAHRFRLNKAICVGRSSPPAFPSPPAYPGRWTLARNFLHTGQLLGWHPAKWPVQIAGVFWRVFAGSLVLAVSWGAGIAGGVA